MKLYNTLTRQVDEFVPLAPPKVTMYTCGPTVYDYQHIGNFRTMTLMDLLHRTLEYNHFEVKTVRNITDIDDKIIKNASEQAMPIKKYTEEYTRIFFEDTEKLNILPVDVTTYATEYVSKMQVFIQDLIAKGFAYIEEDGSVYFGISKFPDYGKLSHLDKSGIKTGMRVLSDEYTKDNVQDFALWKATKPGETQSYDSPWGKGRPGWHIECSVMSQDNLGETIDIHVGGVDLMFPHHENEIAQSEAHSGKPFVRFWVHGEFLNVEGGKMSKSLKNFYTLKDVQEKGFSPLALRYFYLSGHYRTKLNFTWEALEAAKNALTKLMNRVATFKEKTEVSDQPDKIVADKFLEAINDDLNMPEALAVLWEAVDNQDLAAILKFDQVLGLGLAKARKEEIPDNVKSLLAEREKLRQEKKFAEADEVREKIEKLGYTVNDQKT